jgi:hypothetical protein
MAPTAVPSYSIERLFRANNGTVGIPILTPLLYYFSTISNSLQHWYIGSTTGGAGDTGMTMVIAFPRDTPRPPWFYLSQLLTI